MTSLAVVTEISESSIAKIVQGQSADITMDAVQGKHYLATVEQIVPAADRSKGTVLAKVRFFEIDDRVLPEMKTAFMGYTEPSIATRLKEFDREGFTDVIRVPIFLTVRPHTFDDIPTIAGIKEDPHSVQQLKIEKIE